MADKDQSTKLYLQHHFSHQGLRCALWVSLGVRETKSQREFGSSVKWWGANHQQFLPLKFHYRKLE